MKPRKSESRVHILTKFIVFSIVLLSTVIMQCIGSLGCPQQVSGSAPHQDAPIQIAMVIVDADPDDAGL